MNSRCNVHVRLLSVNICIRPGGLALCACLKLVAYVSGVFGFGCFDIVSSSVDIIDSSRILLLE